MRCGVTFARLVLLSLGLACRSSSPERGKSSPADGSVPQTASAGNAAEAPVPSAPSGAAAVDEPTPEETEVRRAKAAEARLGTARLTGAAMAIHDTEYICHLWPEGKIGPVPPFDVRCEDGPDRACVVVEPPEEPDEPWEYSASAWDTPEWRALGYRRFDDHHYRYSVEWHFEGAGEDRRCVILSSAVGDLDGDGVLGTFQRRFPEFSTDSDGELVFRRIVNELE